MGISGQSSAVQPSERTRRRSPSGARQQGMSLIELIVTMTIVAILIGIGAPSYRYVTNSSRTTTEINALLVDLQYARSEAIKEGQPVTVCPSTTGTGCAANSTTWQSGWIVFSDPNNNQTVDTGETILRAQAAFSVATDTFTSDNTVSAITFNREGFASNLPTTAANGYITITLHTTPTNSAWTRCLQVMILGGLTTERVNQGNCS